MHAETHEAGNWWARSRGAHQSEWIATYQNSLEARHRTALVEILKPLAPTTLLEVGAHCGPNLVRFAREFPALEMLGVDINADAVRAGQGWIHSVGLSARIQLSAGRIPQAISRVPTGACDVVLSCYTLAYIAPADLDAVLYEMGRIARRAVVWAEPMTTDGPAPTAMRSLSGYSEWAHNYRDASRWIGSCQGMSWTRHPVAPPIDRLNSILVGVRSGTITSSVQS